MGGVAYTTDVPNYTAFKAMVDGKDEFRFVEEHSLGVNNDDLKVSTENGELIKLENLEKSGHFIYVIANFPKINETKFRVSYFDDQQIVLVYRTKKTIVNLILMH